MRLGPFAALALVLSATLPAWAKADPDTAPLHVDFRVESPDRKTPVAAGSMDMEAEEMTEFENEEGRPGSKLQIHLYSRIHHDGTVAVWAQYEEVIPEGDSMHKIKWQPSMQGKRGTPLTATIRAGQMERTITVVVR